MFPRRGANPNRHDAASALPPGMTAQQAVDALLDREIPPAGLQEAMDLIAGDPAASARLERMRSMFDDLREPTGAPDLSQRVLEEVGMRRRWLPPTLQRLVAGGRLAIAACLLAAVAATLVVQRVHPDAMLFGEPAPTPLTSMMNAGRQEATMGIQRVGGMFDGVFLLRASESDAAAHLKGLSPADEDECAAARACRERRLRERDALVLDLTGREQRWSGASATVQAEPAAVEATRWVILPRNR